MRVSRVLQVEHEGRFVVLGGYSGVERLDSVESFAVGDVETRVLTLLALLVHKYKY